MKLTTTTIISVDGVMQGLGAPDEDRRDGFERGGWIASLLDADAMAFLYDVFARADAFLFGRWTYETWAAYWGAIDDPHHPVAGPLNRRPKFVVSNTTTDAAWVPTTVLSGDIAPRIRDLKAASRGELQVHGSGVLVRWLLQHDLIDELNLVTAPVVVGQGVRLFEDTGPDVVLDLIESRSTPKGTLLRTYRPAGRPAYGVAGSDPARWR